MRLENKGNGDEYFIDLFEKWWHYPLLAFTWFLPHKAYPYKVKDGSVPAKFKFDAKMGLATGLSLILGNVIRSLNLFTLPEEFHWIGKVLAYPISLLALIIAWRYLSKFLKKKNSINFGKYYYFRLSIFSFKTFKIYFLKLLFIFLAMLLLTETVKSDFIGIIIVASVLLFIIVLITLALGAGVRDLEIDGNKIRIK